MSRSRLPISSGRLDPAMHAVASLRHAFPSVSTTEIQAFPVGSAAGRLPRLPVRVFGHRSSRDRQCRRGGCGADRAECDDRKWRYSRPDLAPVYGRSAIRPNGNDGWGYRCGKLRSRCRLPRRGSALRHEIAELCCLSAKLRLSAWLGVQQQRLHGSHWLPKRRRLQRIRMAFVRRGAGALRSVRQFSRLSDRARVSRESLRSIRWLCEQSRLSCWIGLSRNHWALCRVQLDVRLSHGQSPLSRRSLPSSVCKRCGLQHAVSPLRAQHRFLRALHRSRGLPSQRVLQ